MRGVGVLALAAAAGAAVWAFWPGEVKAAPGPPLPPPPPKKEPAPDVPEPLPTTAVRALALCDVGADDVSAWAEAAAVPAFWWAESDPPGAPDSLGSFFQNPYVVLVTADGAFWYWNSEESGGWNQTSWHPAPILAADFCAWRAKNWVSP